MSKLVWDNVQDRRFETGVDRGVLYLINHPGQPWRPGVAWNGLTSVTEDPSGGEPTAYYIDGQKYQNVPASTETAGTIEAYTYPDEFAECDGTLEVGNGLIAYEQQRKPFGLSYRTRVGDGINGIERGYKIHLLYNLLAAPSSRMNGSIGDRTNPITFSWTFTTTPIYGLQRLRSTSHLVLDSTKMDPDVLIAVERTLYGTDTSAPRLLYPDELLGIFDSGIKFYGVRSQIREGVYILDNEGPVDLQTTSSDGTLTRSSDTRLIETAPDSGFYTMES